MTIPGYTLQRKSCSGWCIKHYVSSYNTKHTSYCEVFPETNRDFYIKEEAFVSEEFIVKMSLVSYGVFVVLLAISIRSEKHDGNVPYPTLHLEIPFADYYTLLRILSVSNPLLSEFHQRNSPQGKCKNKF